MKTRAAVVVGIGALVVIAGPAVRTAHARAARAPVRVTLRWLEMLDPVHGYALSGQNPDAYRLLQTSDGGRRWSDVTPGGGTIHPSGPITILGRTTRLFSTKLRHGVFTVERSDDAGRSWHRSVPFRDGRGQGVGQPFAVDPRHLYVALDEGAAAGSQGQALYTSNDGGHSWRFVSRTDVSGAHPQALPFGCDKSGFGFSTPARGWAGGYCAGGGPFFYRTNDGGHTWSRRPLPGLSPCECGTSAPRFFTPRVGVLSVIGFTMSANSKPLVRVYWTSDAGTHWRGTGLRAGRAAGPVSFAAADIAWVAATPPGRIRGPFKRLFRTSDAGRHWQTHELPFDAGGYQLEPVNATVAYALRAVGGSSSILVTTDGGRSWRTIHAVRART